VNGKAIYQEPKVGKNDAAIDEWTEVMDRKAAILMSMGFEIVGVVFFAIFAGRWLDGKYNLNGLATAGFIAVGFVGWLIHVILIAKQLQSSETAQSENPETDRDKP